MGSLLEREICLVLQNEEEQQKRAQKDSQIPSFRPKSRTTASTSEDYPDTKAGKLDSAGKQANVTRRIKTAHGKGSSMK